MNYRSAVDCRFALHLRLLRSATSLLTCLSVAFSLLPIHAQPTATGSLAGSVVSAETRNALQGATVTIPALNRTEFTDNSGSFLIQGLPAGPAELLISYSGFNDEKRMVTVRAGESTRLDATMAPAQTLMMEAFTVAIQKEGQALSITEQRNAVNMKNVTALDEWGVLPTQNVGELVSRLPGITGWQTDEDDLIMNVSICGQPFNYTRLNVDGMSSTGVGGDGRTATLHSFSGSMYEQIEIIAGQTPDKRADSLGGQLNLKTRSPLAMAERRRVSYSASGRYFPGWSSRSYVLAQKPLRPDFSLGYTEVFDIGRGVRNLGVAITASYQEVLSAFDSDLLQYQNTTADTAYLNNYLRKSGTNNRFISALSARADYRLSPSTLVSVRFLYNAGSEPFFSYTDVQPRVTTNLTVYDPVTNPNGAIMPGYTANRTEVRAAGNSSMFLNPQRYSFTSKNPTGTVLFEHNFGRLKVDHAYRWSNTHWDSGAGRSRENGTLQLRTQDGAIGFVLDNSKRFGGVFLQTSGPSVYDPASYRAFQTAAANTTTIPVPQTSVIFNKRDTITDTNEVSANVNATYSFGSEVPIVIKTGLDTINRRVNNRQPYPRRWYGVAGSTLTGNPLMRLTEFEREHAPAPRLPVFDPTVISTTLDNRALWYEDVNFTATSQYTNRRIMEEGVDAAYIQGQFRFRGLTALAGVRGEWVTTDTFTYFRARTTPIAAEPDHFKRAALDYARVSRDGEYHKYFPGVHLSYDLTANLKVRGSYSTSYGRPFLAQLIAGATPNDTARTVTMGNPELRPQMAKNFDLKLEYYFKNSGMISVTGYRKKISDYIGSSARSGILIPDGSDNGFDGLYNGYEIIQASNLGDATLRGIEVDARQRLAFLPGALKGLTARANYTYLETEGRFAGTVGLKSGQVAGFVPRAYNVGLLYNYRKFGASFDVNYTGRYAVGYSLTSPGNGNIYRDKILRMNAGITYKVRPNATAFLNVNNLDEEDTNIYTYTPSRPRQTLIASRSLKFGVSGQF